MFDDDADGARARAEQARKDAAFRDFYQSVKLDIGDESNAGNNRTTYRVSEGFRGFVEDLVSRLTEEGYKVKVEDDDRPVLRMSWEAE